MGYDYSELHRVMKKITEAFEAIAKTLKKFTQDIQHYIVDLSEECNLIIRIKHKPVKEIKPNKIIMLSKRLNTHYCRNNL